ncbi:MAG: hypothetical protein ACO1NS_07910 [Daejeonella sp.]|uniref:hypothetical protein n=1 Tax=Daejeonella sp. JGW-45 TaxID=3034148 RepID=UPI0023ED249C|nr:hypothetical protein [Daejeonella sp. JGW-45]
MKKSILSIIFIILFTAVIPEAKSETVSTNGSASVVSLLFGKSANKPAKNQRVKKRKIKKVVRKVARVYRAGKTDRNSIKTSRKIQRQATRIINIF